MASQLGTAVVSFRRARLNDREFLLRLRKLSMNEHLESAGLFLNDEDHIQRIDEFFFDSYIIIYKHKTIGLIKLALFSTNIHIRQFQLLPTYQGGGIGGRVLELIKRKAQDKQLNITLNVLLNNPAKHLYLRHGFSVIQTNVLEHQMQWQSRVGTR